MTGAKRVGVANRLLRGVADATSFRAFKGVCNEGSAGRAVGKDEEGNCDDCDWAFASPYMDLRIFSYSLNGCF